MSTNKVASTTQISWLAPSNTYTAVAAAPQVTHYIRTPWWKRKDRKVRPRGWATHVGPSKLSIMSLFAQPHSPSNGDLMKFGKKANRLPIRAVLRDQPITLLLRAGGTEGARALQGYYDITNFWLQDPEMSEMANQWTLFQQGVGGRLYPPHYYWPSRFLNGAASLGFIY